MDSNSRLGLFTPAGAGLGLMAFLAPWVLDSCGGTLNGAQIAFMGGNFTVGLITASDESLRLVRNTFEGQTEDAFALFAMCLTLALAVALMAVIGLYFYLCAKGRLKGLRKAVIATAVIAALDIACIIGYSREAQGSKIRFGVWLMAAACMVMLAGLPYLKDRDT